MRPSWMKVGALAVGLIGSSIALPVSAADPRAAPSPATAGVEQLPLTLESLEALALQHNPTLVQAAANIDISQGRALQAGLLPNPQIGFSAEQIGVEGTPGEFYGGFVQQEIPLGGKLRLSRQKYRQEAFQGVLRAETQQLRVLNGVRMRFYEVLAAQRLAEVRGQLLEIADEAVLTTREMLNVGQANRSDLLQSEVQASRIRFEARAAQARLKSAWEELIAIVGTPELCYSPLTGSLEPEGQPLDFEAELCRLYEQSPELKVAEAEVVRDQISLQRERVEPIPNLTLRGGAGHNYESNDTVAEASISLRVPLFDRNQGTIRQARAELTRAQADVVRIKLLLRQRLAEVFARYQTGMEAIELVGKEGIAKAQEAYELQLQNFRNRRAAWPQVLTAQRDYLELTEQYVDLLRELRRAEIEIRGLLIIDGLSPPPTPVPEGHRDAVPKPR